MPPTHLTPALRRQLSDEARKLLFRAHGSDILDLPTSLQNMRANLMIQTPRNGPLYVQLVASGLNYMYRYHLEAIGADILVLVRNGSATKWITYATGDHEALNVFLADFQLHDPQQLNEPVLKFLDIVAQLDVLDIIQVSSEAILQQSEPTRIYTATTPLQSYRFICDGATGCPISIDCISQQDENHIKIQVTYYNRLVSQVVIEAPLGILSDVERMMKVAMEAYSTWSYEAQIQMQNLIDEIDHDRDGFVGRYDLIEQLCRAKHSLEAARRTAKEMTRILGDNGNPSEEITYDSFLAFWMVMLADGSQMCDINDEIAMLKAFRQLFYGEQNIIRV
ncbi:hypothetical protein THRCLA_22509 [Thraustotheca clavata]|uniref:Uncharacterized protein n=1 Tax=Thraustotheca clavata TaxID=74557 RepID=A0A1V9YZ47_9STRA|nr:hypothetical protein THRCLA_22509 [Thraustotheca clavata]